MSEFAPQPDNTRTTNYFTVLEQAINLLEGTPTTNEPLPEAVDMVRRLQLQDRLSAIRERHGSHHLFVDEDIDGIQRTYSR